MKKDRVSVTILRDIRRVKEGAKYPLKLKVTYQGERKYYGTGFDASDQEWEAISQGNVQGDLRRIKLGIAELEVKAVAVAEKIVPFSFKQFEDQFFEKSLRFESLRSAFDAQIARLEANDQWVPRLLTGLPAMPFIGFGPKLAWRTLTRVSLKSSKSGFWQKGCP